MLILSVCDRQRVFQGGCQDARGAHSRRMVCGALTASHRTALCGDCDIDADDGAVMWSLFVAVHCVQVQNGRYCALESRFEVEQCPFDCSPPKRLFAENVCIRTIEGRLEIVDRKKNIFKLSQGEYIRPEFIQNVYGASRFVANIFVHGNSLQNYLVAIIVPDAEALQQVLIGVVVDEQIVIFL